MHPLRCGGLALTATSGFGGTMRILLVTETLTAGGAETFVIRLANALATGHQVTIAVLHGEMVHDTLIGRVDPAVRLERLILPAKRTLFRADGLLRRLKVDWSVIRRAQQRWLAEIADRVSPDVIHSHLLKADRVAADVSAGRPALRHVITLHGDYAPFLSGQADPQMLGLRPAMQRILANADAIVAICNDQMTFVRRNFVDAVAKTQLIYNGYAPRRTEKPAPSRSSGKPLTFGMVSRGVERKGWAKAVAAFRSLPRGAAALVLVGEGPAIERLRRGDLPEGVRLAGFSPDPVGSIRDFDVGLLPTEFPHESLPTVVMEYLFCGKPVIATDVGEIGAMIRDPAGDYAGTLLAFDGDRIATEELAAAMRAYIDHPALRRRHASRAMAAFAKFDMGACAEAYSRLYAEAASSPSNSATSASH